MCGARLLACNTRSPTLLDPCTSQVLAGRHLLPKPIDVAPVIAPSVKEAPVAKPPRGTVRLWLTLGLIGTLMTLAAQRPKALLPMALACLCVLVRLGCLDLKEAWSAVNGPVLLSIALSLALGEAISKSELATMWRRSAEKGGGGGGGGAESEVPRSRDEPR